MQGRRFGQESGCARVYWFVLFLIVFVYSLCVLVFECVCECGRGEEEQRQQRPAPQHFVDERERWERLSDKTRE